MRLIGSFTIFRIENDRVKKDISQNKKLEIPEEPCSNNLHKKNISFNIYMSKQMEIHMNQNI